MTLRNVLMVCMALALFSCSKDKSASPGHLSNDTAGYQPVTAGSSWKYEDAVNPKGGFTLTATNRDTVINNVTFNIFSRKPDTSDQAGEAYFAQDEDNYYAIGLIQIPGDNGILYLKDTTANSTWTQDISFNYLGVSINAELDFTLVQVNLSKKIHNTTYENVAQVSLSVRIPVPGAPSQVYATGEFYFSRGVGVIAAKFVEGSSTISDISLDSYTIR